MSSKGIPEEDRKEIFQEFFIRVSKSIGNLRNRGGASSFFHAVVDNLVKDYFSDKLKKRYDSIDTFGGEEDSEEGRENVILSRLSEEMYIEKLAEEEIRETAEAIIDFLKKESDLGDDCAELLLYFYRWLKVGLSQKEMAQSMGLKPNTFNQRLKRCKERIRKKLINRLS
ncbi:MAG: sigma-70 family RNA polymerase sigma factor [Deferribacteres bacterium]|nr:sigma-70 family RNA polymerase sigma factor [Deferribacteres bacterium]